MSRSHLTEKGRADRQAARRKILAAATKFSRDRALKMPRLQGYVFLSKPYTARHIQRAVSVCRNRKLVDGGVLAAAGFNPGKPSA